MIEKITFPLMSKTPYIQDSERQDPMLSCKVEAKNMFFNYPIFIGVL